MARVKKDSVFEGIRGTVGKELVFKHYGDKTVVSRYPDMSGIKPSKAQELQRKKMAEATAYASRVLRDAKLSAVYAAQLRPGESVFHKAKSHFFEMLKKGEVVVEL